MRSGPRRAVRARIEGAPSGDGLVAAIRDRARDLGLLGWVRRDGGAVAVHAEGGPDAIADLVALIGAEAGSAAAVEAVEPEGHEQFATRGVRAGSFVVREQRERGRRFELRLEVGARMRSWTVPKGPSLDPAVKRLAIAAPDRDPADNESEGAAGDGAAIVWDRGGYEQGGRVPWPEALERGHAVFVLHGEKLRGGFALQRTGGANPRWLLVKRVDEEARPGSDIVAEQPRSPVSGRPLDEIGQ